MEQLVIEKANGSKLFLFNRVESAEQVKEFMGQDVVNIEIVSATPLSFDIGDSLTVFGERYTINLLPEGHKVNDRRFEYTVRFEGVQYDLIRVQMLDIDSSGFSNGLDFSLVAPLDDYVSLIVTNLNRVYGQNSWIIGDVTQNTEAKTVTFSNNNCLEALQNVCDNYGVNFSIERIGNAFQLNVVKIDAELPDVFKYGRHKGLYDLARTNVDNKNIVTRLFAFGGTTNIPSNYRGGSTRLKLPFSTIPSEGQPYLTDPTAVAEYGITEGSITFEDIYPNRTGTISAIDATSELIFVDSSMPFDLNAQLMPGLSAKINFKTGALSGYSFDVVSYNNTTKAFKINTFTDERGQVFPSVAPITAFRAAVGDTYTLTDISMPQSYVNDAEYALFNKALEELSIQSVPAVQWQLTIDANYIKSKETIQGQIINYFVPGYLLTVVDPDLKISGKSQIVGFTRNILKPYQYSLTVSEEFVNRREIKRRNLRLGITQGEQLPTTSGVMQLINQANQSQATNIYNTINSSVSSQVAEVSNFGGREW